jgi:hypothetical protein
MRLPQSIFLMSVFGPEAQLPARKANPINDSHVNFIRNDKNENSLLGDQNVLEKELNVNKRKPQDAKKAPWPDPMKTYTNASAVTAL